MRNLDKALAALKFDKRMMDWNLTNKVISATEVENHKKSLNDLAPNAIPLDLEEDSSDDNLDESY